MVEAKFYVTLTPTFGSRYHEGKYGPGVTNLRATKITSKRPTGKAAVGAVTTELTVRIPEGAFLPLMPAAVITVPEDMIVAGDAIEVDATDDDL